MGREIRMVPPHWEHPKKKYTNDFQPMFERSFAEAVTTWRKEFAEFYESKKNETEKCEFWEWDGGPPDRAYYIPYSAESATWYQLYETVSEGTPVSPPFDNRQELANYLAANGDFWDQSRRERGHGLGMDCQPWGQDRAERFVFGTGYAPSLVVTGNQVISGVEFVTKQENT